MPNNNLEHIAFILDGNKRWAKKNSVNLKNAYKTFKGTTTYNNISTKSAASLVNAQAANSTAIFGGNTKKSLKGGNKDKDKLKSYYFEYTKDTNKFIKQNMLKVIQEQNSVIEKKIVILINQKI